MSDKEQRLRKVLLEGLGGNGPVWGNAKDFVDDLVQAIKASGLMLCGEGEVCVPISQNSRGFCIYNGPCEYRLGRSVQAAQQQSSEVE